MDAARCRLYGEMNSTKVYLAVWLIVLVASLIIIEVYILQFRWWIPLAYGFVFIILPLVYIFYKLFPATSTADFHRLSVLTKSVMLTGILSMAFFYFYL